MIITILAFLYVTFLCQSYGSCLSFLLSKMAKTTTTLRLPFIIRCFSGLALIGVLFSFLSLFIGLDKIQVHILLILPTLLFGYKKRFDFFCLPAKVMHRFAKYPVIILVLLIACILLVLLMHSWIISHPDTLIYHAQNIQWINKYRAIPGIAHLHTNYGIQSSWFVICALFSFNFAGFTSLTFINAIVLVWFILFVVDKINDNLQYNGYGVMWVSLLIISFWSYTQIRLTATSASPDFIAALYCWLVIYLYTCFTDNRNSAFFLLLTFLTFFAITIKLSIIPLLLLPIWAYYNHAVKKKLIIQLLPIIVGILAIFPFLTRNVISSGYLFFPLSFPDIFPVDWKISETTLYNTRRYITAYARANINYSQAEQPMKIVDWFPVWWHLRSTADKLIIASIPVIGILLLLFRRRVNIKKNTTVIISLLCAAIGILFWFLQAPDPRFGFGFLIPAIGAFIYLLPHYEIKKIKQFNWQLLKYILAIFTATIMLYTSYRFYYYFTPKNIFLPSGIGAHSYQTVICKGIKINIPLSNNSCGSISVPCGSDSCTFFIPRSSDLMDGFKGR